MTDYSQLKVPELKKLLQEASLPLSGNKADLISRLQENDEKKAGGAPAPAAAEDEIDWDEDESKATTAPAAAAIAAGGQGQVANPVAVPNQQVDTDPSATTDLKVVGGEDAPTAEDGAVASAGTTTENGEPEAPKPDFSIGIQQTDAEKEAEKRAARAKRFGITEDDEAKRLAERAKKFGLENKPEVIKGLDDALPERRPKRVREGKEGGRASKRQTPDRRTEPAKSTNKPAPSKKPLGKIVDDPAEKAKAEARAKRFQQAA
ncbi:sap domain-containing protein [Phlyctema vagabunda]|uniref:Sap domain-containing protein n=1 Tax=Phlyctema vagabunda TaxID=108571 RepID=A0ABR4PPU1_9HELO